MNERYGVQPAIVVPQICFGTQSSQTQKSLVTLVRNASLMPFDGRQRFTDV